MREGAFQAELARRGAAENGLGGAEAAALQERAVAAEAERDKARQQLMRCALCRVLLLNFAWLGVVKCAAAVGPRDTDHGSSSCGNALVIPCPWPCLVCVCLWQQTLLQLSTRNTVRSAPTASCSVLWLHLCFGEWRCAHAFRYVP